MFQRGCKKLGVIFLFLLLAGCSFSTTFQSYPHKIAPLQQQLTRPPSSVDLSSTFKRERRGSDKILYNLEHGRAAQLLGQTEISRNNFAVAIAAIRSNEERALVSASQIGASLASFATNDNALPYLGEGYERVLLHHYQALNYLLEADLSGAAVEFRWANNEQREALNRHAKELDRAEKEAQKKGVGNPAENNEFQRRYAQLDEAAGRLKNSFQNAYSFYLSGVVYELQREENDAYIDYKKALEIYPENVYVQRDVLRLARRLQMDDDLATLAKRFPTLYNTTAVAEKREEGEIILLYEEGFVPPREEIKIPFFLPGGIVTLAFPYYRGPWRDYYPSLEVMTGNTPLGRTEFLCDVRGLALKSLQEKMPILLTRQVVRAVSKSLAQQAARQKFGDIGQLGMMVYSVISENADLRSWLTLPENVQILRVNLPSGEQQLRLQSPNSLLGTNLAVDVKSGGKTIVYAVKTGNQFHTATVSFEK
ncbi:MAG: hypothetical protein Q7U44_12500 [Desulfuromonadales bacterium]|nr:hypothetical protein [Desulfuromonadales bacterium]